VKVLRKRCLFKGTLSGNFVEAKVGAFAVFLTLDTTVFLGTIDNSNLLHICIPKVAVILPDESAILPFFPVYMNTRYVYGLKFTIQFKEQCHQPTVTKLVTLPFRIK